MKLQKYFLYIPKKITSSLENSNIPLSSIFFTFFSITFLRNFLESFSQSSINYFDLNQQTLILNWIHFSLSYFSGSISLILLLYFAVKVDIFKITRVVLPCFFILILPPIIDLIVTGGKGADIFYLGVRPIQNPVELLLYFKNYSGITLGMRIEIAIALYAIFCYIFLKRQQIFVSLLYTFLAYELIFIYCAAPAVLQSFITYLGFSYHTSSLNMIRCYIILITITGCLFCYIARPKMFIHIVKDLRFLRLLHYFLMLTLGIILVFIKTPLSLHDIFEKNPEFIFNYILCLFSIVFAGLFSIITNNITDIDIDRISNKSRPLVQEVISDRDYRFIGQGAFILSLIFALIAGFKEFLIMITVIGNYYIYSMPPLRLKRTLIISKLIIAFNSLSMVALGFIIVTKNLIGFPMILIPIFLIGITAISNFIDIKDYEGDKQCGIVTMPGILGLKITKLIVSIGFVLTYMSFYFIVNKPIFLPFLTGAGLLQIILVNQKKYNEIPVFIFYLLSLIIFISCILVGKILQ